MNSPIFRATSPLGRSRAAFVFGWGALTALVATSSAVVFPTRAAAQNVQNAQVAQETQTVVFDFESGELAAEGWALVEGENSRPIGARSVEFHNESVPYDKNGERYLTTLESSADARPTDDVRCVLESPVFEITGDEATALVGGGGKNRADEFVALAVLNDDGSVEDVLKAVGDDSQKLAPVVWNVAPFRGRRALIRVVDLGTGGWGHIRCDNFRIPARLDADGTALRRQYVENCRAEEARRAAETRAAALESLRSLDASILYVRRNQYKPDHHNTATLFQRGEINEGSFVGGSALVVWNPATDESQILLDVPDGIVRDPALSFDATKVLFSLRKSKDDDYHLAELDLDLTRPALKITAETTSAELENAVGFRQLTFVSGASDFDPLYLPTGEIVFSSTREPKYCMCNRHIMGNLHKMNGDGSNVRQIGKSTLFEGHSALLSDGRLIYDRWEYVDRNFGDAQGVWVANPDGSKHEIFWGNNTASPGGVLDARPTPESDSVFVCVLGSCHDRPWGAVALIDRRLGVDGRAAVLKTWPPETIDWVSDAPGPDPMKQVVKYDTFSRSPRKYEDPFPLDDGSILAAGQIGNGEETGLYVLGPDGDSTLVRTDAPGCFDPTPILPTEPPKTIADRVDETNPNGCFHVSNVYEGFGMSKVAPGSVKRLRVVESPEKRHWTQPLWDWKGTGTQAPAMAWDDYNNKRILGTVPVAEDGSVSFEVPAEKFVYFQLLDEDGLTIQSMRSGIMVRPGETNACVGCHESRLDAPESGALAGAATSGTPQKLEPWLGAPPRLFSFREEVQPVFDRYCVACHDFGKPAGETLVLAGDRNPVFCASYWNLRIGEFVRVPGAGPHNKLEPLFWGARTSRLAQIFLKGHPKPEIDEKRRELGLYVDKTTDPEAFARVATWIDINAPYYPTYASAYRDDPHGRSPLTSDETNRLKELTGLKDDLAFIPAISFDRPEMSPSLARLVADGKNAESPEYREALDLIRAGGARLSAQDRGEASDFAPVAPVEIEREKRYEYFRKRQELVRDAIVRGVRLNDRDVDAALGATWRTE